MLKNFLKSLLFLHKPEEFKNHFVIPIAIIIQCIILYTCTHFLNNIPYSYIEDFSLDIIFIIYIIFSCFYFFYYLFKYTGNEWLKLVYLFVYLVCNVILIMFLD